MSMTVAGVTAARADLPGNLTVTTGAGDGLSIKHGWFGTRDVKVKDRLGDQFERKKGLFSRKTEANLLGNQVETKKGLLSGTTVNASDMFGDQ